MTPLAVPVGSTSREWHSAFTSCSAATCPAIAARAASGVVSGAGRDWSSPSRESGRNAVTTAAASTSPSTTPSHRRTRLTPAIAPSLPAGRPDPAASTLAAVKDLEARYRARSLWLDGLPGSLEPRPPLPGDTQCDVCVVGAGFTGLWTAYYLKTLQPDLRVVVVEREIAGFGAVRAATAAGCRRSPAKPSVYAAATATRAVLAAERETFRTVTEIGRVAATEEIDCGFLKAGQLVVAASRATAGAPARASRAGAAGLRRGRHPAARPDEPPSASGVQGALGGVVLAALRPRRSGAAVARPGRRRASAAA